MTNDTDGITLSVGRVTPVAERPHPLIFPAAPNRQRFERKPRAEPGEHSRSDPRLSLANSVTHPRSGSSRGRNGLKPSPGWGSTVMCNPGPLRPAAHRGATSAADRSGQWEARMAYAKIVQEWPDGTVAAMEAGGDLDDLEACVAAVCAQWRECVKVEPEAEPETGP